MFACGRYLGGVGELVCGAVVVCGLNAHVDPEVLQRISDAVVDLFVTLELLDELLGLHILLAHRGEAVALLTQHLHRHDDVVVNDRDEVLALSLGVT